MIGFDDIYSNSDATYSVICETAFGELLVIRRHDFFKSIVKNEVSKNFIL